MLLVCHAAGPGFRSGWGFESQSFPIHPDPSRGRFNAAPAHGIQGRFLCISGQLMVKVNARDRLHTRRSAGQTVQVVTAIKSLEILSSAIQIYKKKFLFVLNIRRGSSMFGKVDLGNGKEYVLDAIPGK